MNNQILENNLQENMVITNANNNCIDDNDDDKYDDADSNDDDDEWGTDEQRTNDDNLQFYPMFHNNQTIYFETLKEALQYDVQNYNFNLLDYLPINCNNTDIENEDDDDDFFEKTIVIINKARLFVKETLSRSDNDSNCDHDSKNYYENGKLLNEYMKNEIMKLQQQNDYNNNSYENDDKDDEEYERYFIPVLKDDTLIMCMDDLQDIMKQKKGEQEQQNENSTIGNVQSSSYTSSSLNKQLQNKIEILEEQLQQAKEYIAKLADMNNTTNNNNNSKPKKDNDTYYFSSYSHSSIHETMLQDTIRTKAYQNAILQNKHLFENKVVMDIGCGTGILSLFAAQAGAKKVIAIDASDVYIQANEIVDLNGYSHIIKVIHGKVEDLITNNHKLPLLLLDEENNEKVDVVISEWMGYALLYETMLPSVMSARDHFMDKVNGTMWPNKSTMFIEGATDSRLDYWDDVYGMNMQPMKVKVTNELRKEASVEIVDKENVVTNRAELKRFDLNESNDEDLDFKSIFELKCCQNGKGEVKVDKLVVSFDVDFDLPGCHSVSFSTGCQSEPTHWKQTTLWFDPENAPLLKSGEVLKGSFTVNRNESNQRDMDFFVSWEIGFDSFDFKPRDKGTILSRLSS